ncbi:hypothetical protein MOQ_003825 [Trypanosoma cruzi marinkellei]|uniref:Spermidine synthase n=1 Tax=Trypanosoma cruzi marinkellei TaxID=85056 RepID=K2N312_TRYCR|nr:hypothetical protein MOQ_003825 [Trypanosoma cruzi marinkellei]
MPYFVKSLSGRACGILAGAATTAVLLAFGGFYDGETGWLRRARRQDIIPLFDANTIERVEEYARYPCQAFPGYSVVVSNYYTRVPTDDVHTSGGGGGGSKSLLRRLFSLFSNDAHTVDDRGDPSANENLLHLVREVVGDSRAPLPDMDTSTTTTTAAVTSPFVASSTWPLGTAKYAAMTMEPSSSFSTAGEPVDVMRRLADRTTHQSLIRCDPFASPSMNCSADASYLGAPYLRMMLSAFLLLPSPLPRLRVAVLGVGGGSLPSFLQQHFSRDIMRLDLVDAEPQCFRAAVEDLGLRETMRGGAMSCHVSDAAAFLKEAVTGLSEDAAALLHSGISPPIVKEAPVVVEGRQRTQRYDVLFVDLFVGSVPPAFLSSSSFLQLCHGVLSSLGVAAFNLPAPDPEFMVQCRRVFGRGNVFQIPVPASANVVVIARRVVGKEMVDGVPISRRHFYRRAEALQKSHALPYDLAGHYPFWWRFW